MEITAFDVYLIAQIDTIRSGLAFLVFCYLVVNVVAFLVTQLTLDEWGWPTIREKEQREKFNIGRKLAIFAIGFLAISLIPSTKTAVTMLVAPAVVNSQIVQELPDDLHKLIKQLIKEDE